MKLPRPATRRYLILRAFLGKRMTLDDLVASYGLFRLETRSHLLTELKALRQLGYLESGNQGFWLSADTEAALKQAGEYETQIVQPRQYSVYESPPLKADFFRNPLRRKSPIEDAPSVYGAGK